MLMCAEWLHEYVSYLNKETHVNKLSTGKFEGMEVVLGSLLQLFRQVWGAMATSWIKLLGGVCEASGYSNYSGLLHPGKDHCKGGPSWAI